MLEHTRPFIITAADVSSQEDSMAKITGFGIIFRIGTKLQIAAKNR
jgi:hypothetical protein